MGDADQHTKVGVQLFLKRGAWQAWLLATSGFKPLLDGLVHLGDVPAPPIVQGRLSLYAELLEPAVGAGSTDADSCTTGGFLPGISFLHQHHHLLFCRLALLTFHRYLAKSCLIYTCHIFCKKLLAWMVLKKGEVAWWKARCF